jgi:hypothetical protein
VDATWLKRRFASGAKAVSGKMQATFARLEEIQGDMCAVIYYRGAIKVRSEPEEVLRERIETCDMELVTYRSLKYGISTRIAGDIFMKSTGKMKIDESECEFVGSGRTRITYQAAVEK